MPAQYALFENMKGWQLVCQDGVLLSLSENVLGYLQNVNMYSHGRDKISDLLNRFLHEFLDVTPVIILPVLFCKVDNTILLLGDKNNKKTSILTDESSTSSRTNINTTNNNMVG
jgi:hypothetical protein